MSKENNHEIERKFLIKSKDYKKFYKSKKLINQGYLNNELNNTYFHFDLDSNKSYLRIDDLNDKNVFSTELNEIESQEIYKILTEKKLDKSKTIKININQNTNNATRIRYLPETGFAELTMKSANKGIKRKEINIKINEENAKLILESFTLNVKKNRYIVEFANKIWDIDEFLELNKPLIIGEIELDHEKENIEFPLWINPEDEVSEERKYYNSELAINPYSTW